MFNSSKQAGGFTLIEVLVALAVVSIGFVAISNSLSRSIDVVQELELKTIASWVASNRMAELRMKREFRSSGTETTNQSMAGRSWKIVDNFFTTADPNIARVVVEVYLEKGSERAVVSDVGYLAKYNVGTG